MELKTSEPESAMRKVIRNIISSENILVIVILYLKVYEEAKSDLSRQVSSSEEVLEILTTNSKSIYWGATGSFIAEEKIESFDIKEIITSELSIGLQKNSELKSMFDYQFTKLRQSGIYQHIYHFWIEKGLASGSSTESTDETANTLGYDNLLMPFLILISGVGMSAGIAILERIYTFFNKYLEPNTAKIMYPNYLSNNKY